MWATKKGDIKVCKSECMRNYKLFIIYHFDYNTLTPKFLIFNKLLKKLRKKIPFQA